MSEKSGDSAVPSRVLFVGMNRISIPEREIGEVRNQGEVRDHGIIIQDADFDGDLRRFEILGLSAAARSQLRHHAIDDWVRDAFRQIE